jgi:DNA polymerase III delta prime subunit
MSKYSPSSIEDVRAILEHQLAQLWAKPERAGSIAPLMLWGPPGIGKSTVVREVCTAKKIEFLDVRLAQREPIDLRGLPVPNREGNGVDWLVSAEWPRDPASRGVILFDELTAADRTLQVAAYELILDRRLGTLYQVPPGWLLVAAGNRASDRAVAGTMSSALANRFCHLEVLPDLEEWVLWARANNVHPDVLGLLSTTPELFFSMENVDVQRGWPSPRSWERVGVVLDHATELPERAVHRLIEGLIGPSAAAALTAFRTSARELPNVPSLLDGDQPIRLPRRSDLRCALISAIAYHLWRAPRREQAFQRLFEVLAALEDDFATLLVHETLRGRSETEVRSFLLHPEYARIQKRLGEKLRGRLTRASDAMLRGVLIGLGA